MVVKRELAERLAERTGLSVSTSLQAVDAVFAVIRDVVLHEVRPVVIRRFGTFHPVQREACTARNPRTGEPVQVPAKKAVRFRPSKKLVKELFERN